MDQLWRVVLFYSLLSFSSCQGSNLAVDTENLLDNLWKLSSAARRFTPPFNENGTVLVNFGVALNAVLDVNLDNGVMDLLCWDKLMWKDERLSWDPLNHGGIKHLRVPSDMIWKPDVMSYNSFESDEASTRAEVLAVVDYKGDVKFIPPTTRRIKCDINGTTGLASCSMKFGSWTYPGNMLDLNFVDDDASLDLSNFTPSGKVDGIPDASNKAEKNAVLYDCCPETYVDLMFRFDLEMNTTY